jgi:predicted MFS family arabinose efflux permease
VLAVTERRVAHPMLRPALLRSRERLGGLAIVALVFGSQFAMFFLTVQYVQNVLGFGALAAGAAFLPMTLGIFAMSRVTPRLVGRFGQAPLLMAGTFGLTISFAWLSGADASSTFFAAVFGPMLLNGISAGLTFMPAASLVVGGVEPEHAGSASGLLQTTQQLGGAIGLAVIVSVYAAGAVSGAFLPGAREAYLATATFALLAFGVATSIGLRSRRSAQDGPILEGDTLEERPQ